MSEWWKDIWHSPRSVLYEVLLGFRKNGNRLRNFLIKPRRKTCRSPSPSSNFALQSVLEGERCAKTIPSRASASSWAHKLCQYSANRKSVWRTRRMLSSLMKISRWDTLERGVKPPAFVVVWRRSSRGVAAWLAGCFPIFLSLDGSGRTCGMLMHRRGSLGRVETLFQPPNRFPA